ncbi:alpha/beta hydrolase [Gordonia spumicola]|uniref:Alpha/beta hydrolase n=1 Tax=Gordonia spumicola TaxID=589161 RepID=A0A7I9V747_9ACTN|nr:alpha/beta hydrolase [Gordonia spumicola]
MVAALADAGYVMIAFDASYRGEPRWTKDPAQRVRDFSFVVDHLVTLPFVDADHIGVLGVCGGGGYSISASLTGRRIKAVASITGVNFGHLLHEAFSAYDPITTLELIAAQRTAEARGAVANVENLLPPTVDDAQGLDIDVAEATEYYKTDRGQAPNGCTQSLVSRRAGGFGWDAFTHAEVLQTQPLLMVIGDKPGAFGAYRDGMEIYRRSPSTNKQLVVAEGYSHYDLYDLPAATTIALDAAIPFFNEHL